MGMVVTVGRCDTVGPDVGAGVGGCDGGGVGVDVTEGAGVTCSKRRVDGIRGEMVVRVVLVSNRQQCVVEARMSDRRLAALGFLTVIVPWVEPRAGTLPKAPG